MLLKRKPPRNKESLVIRDKGRVTGKRKEFSDPAYPVEFGESVAAVYKIEIDKHGQTISGKKRGGKKIAGVKRKFQDTFFDDPVLIR